MFLFFSCVALGADVDDSSQLTGYSSTTQLLFLLIHRRFFGTVSVPALLRKMSESLAELQAKVRSLLRLLRRSGFSLQMKAQGEKVRQMKKDGASRDDLKPEVDILTSLRADVEKMIESEAESNPANKINRAGRNPPTAVSELMRRLVRSRGSLQASVPVHTLLLNLRRCCWSLRLRPPGVRFEG